MASDLRSTRTDAEQKEIEELQSRLADLLGVTESTKETSSEQVSRVYHGIGAVLSSGDADIFEKWKKQFAKDMKGCTHVQFDGSAWLTWRKVVILDLQPTGMFYLLDTGKTVGATGLLESKELLADTLFQRYLLGRLTDKPRRTVTTCADVYQVWSKLKTVYASATVTMQNTLKDEWESLVQAPTQTVQEFIQSLDYLAMSMEAATVGQDDRSKYHRLMKGLGPQWSAQKEILDTTRSNYTDACQILIELGEKRGERADGSIVPAYSAVTRPEERKKISFRQVMCYTCGSGDHTQDQCPTGLKPSYDSFGNQITRCFKCLVEGHRSRQCPTRKSSVSRDPK